MLKTSVKFEVLLNSGYAPEVLSLEHFPNTFMVHWQFIWFNIIPVSMNDQPIAKTFFNHVSFVMFPIKTKKV